MAAADGAGDRCSASSSCSRAAAFRAVPLAARAEPRTTRLRRLDRNSGLPHRPATAIADEIAVATEDPFRMALWRAHVERALRAAKTLKAGAPAPRLAVRDPFALRALVAVLVVATFVAAGGERMKRIAAAFDWQGVMAAGQFPHRCLGARRRPIPASRR